MLLTVIYSVPWKYSIIAALMDSESASKDRHAVRKLVERPRTFLKDIHFTSEHRGMRSNCAAEKRRKRALSERNASKAQFHVRCHGQASEQNNGNCTFLIHC